MVSSFRPVGSSEHSGRRLAPERNFNRGRKKASRTVRLANRRCGGAGGSSCSTCRPLLQSGIHLRTGGRRRRRPPAHRPGRTAPSARACTASGYSTLARRASRMQPSTSTYTSPSQSSLHSCGRSWTMQRAPARTREAQSSPAKKPLETCGDPDPRALPALEAAGYYVPWLFDDASAGPTR